VIVRRATAADYEAAKELEQEILQLHYSNRKDFFRYREEALPLERFVSMIEGDCIFLLAEENSIVIGQAVALKRSFKDHPVFNDMEWLEIDDISVRSEAQGKGVGTALFNAIKAEARILGLKHIELTVWGFNKSARAFYEKMGMHSRIDRLELDIE